MSGSGGVVIPPAGYLQRLREICTQHDILLIFDEVITGFGRLGAMTAAEAFGVTPDIMNIAKQVSNGAQPLGACVVTPAIYDQFMAAGGPQYMLEFAHGYTYSAHPVACAAAIAALDLLEREDGPGRVRALAPSSSRPCTASRAPGMCWTSAISAWRQASRLHPCLASPPGALTRSP
jgi:beta-alanine--pyruvate transaminase